MGLTRLLDGQSVRKSEKLCNDASKFREQVLCNSMHMMSNIGTLFYRPVSKKSIHFIRTNVKYLVLLNLSFKINSVKRKIKHVIDAQENHFIV